jgi:hypothetical protein
MTYKITARTEPLVLELGALAGDIESDLLGAASPDARQEWNALRLSWPTADQISAGAIGLSDDELAFMVGKVHRFRSILRGLNAAKPPQSPRRRSAPEMRPREPRTAGLTSRAS